MKLWKAMLAICALSVAPFTAHADCGTCGTDGKEGHEATAQHHSGETHAYEVGSSIEDFKLPHATEGQEKSLSELAGAKGVALIFWNQECPFVLEAQERIAEFHNAYKDKGITVVAVDAGTNNPVEKIKPYAESLPFPILVNNDSEIAAKFAATRTPEVFLVDSDMKVRYHGAFDNGKLQGENATRESYLKDAAEALLAGSEIKVEKTKAFGCTLKYAEGVKPKAAKTAKAASEKTAEDKSA